MAALWVLLVLILAVMQLPPILVLGPLAAWSFSAYEPVPATIFTIWSLLVSVSDSFLKPVLLGRGVDIPMLVILLLCDLRACLAPRGAVTVRGLPPQFAAVLAERPKAERALERHQTYLFFHCNQFYDAPKTSPFFSVWGQVLEGAKKQDMKRHGIALRAAF